MRHHVASINACDDCLEDSHAKHRCLANIITHGFHQSLTCAGA